MLFGHQVLIAIAHKSKNASRRFLREAFSLARKPDE
jgi:hypothetical protein